MAIQVTQLRGAEAPAPQRQPLVRRQAWKLYLLLVVCVAPVIASYFAYYVFPPSDRSNYGALIEPQRPVPTLASKVVHAPVEPRDASGPGGSANPPQVEGLQSFKGRWIMLGIDSGACEVPCAEKLFFMRQTHVALGKERGRLLRVLLVTDDSALPTAVLAAHPDLVVLRVAPDALRGLFPVEAATTLTDHIYLIDPLQNLMMRFPKNPDPAKTRKDLQKLMKASRIG
ncbi:MAG TPA: cytochrome C oxidase subunit I [Lautropia sp.]|nr:cytochrome C oxidase subunit I [Lautropia sp.]